MLFKPLVRDPFTLTLVTFEWNWCLDMFILTISIFLLITQIILFRIRNIFSHISKGIGAVSLTTTFVVSSSLEAASFWRQSWRRSCYSDFLLQDDVGGGGRGWGMWGWSGWPSMADSCMWRLPASHDSSSFVVSPCQKLASAASRLDILDFLYLKIR